MRRSILILILLTGPLPADAQSHVPAGPPFAVNTYTTGGQWAAQIASDAAGTFVVVWNSGGQDGSGYGVFARTLDAAGSPAGPEFQVNAYTTNSQLEPSVAVDAGGRARFVWRGGRQGGAGVQGRVFSGGVPEGDEFEVSAPSSTTANLPWIAAGADGRFAVVWTDLGVAGNQNMIGRRFDPDGVPFGAAFLVNTYTTGIQASIAPSIAAAADGRFVVAWQSNDQDGSQTGVFAQRYDAAGAAAGPEFRVNETTLNGQFRPVVASDAAGNFVVAWTGPHAVGGGSSLLARRFDAAGVPQGGEFLVQETPGRLYAGGLAVDPGTGHFVVVWHDGNIGAVRGRVFDATGPVSPELPISTPASSGGTPSVAFGAGGDFVVSWVSMDADSYGIVARRYLPDLIFADGVESGDLTRWSSSAVDGGDLSVSGAAALDGTNKGLRGVVNDVTSLFVQDESPADEGRYRARFWMDPQDFDPGVAQGHRRTRVLVAFTEAPSRRVAALVLRSLNGVYSVMGRARLDNNAQADTGFIDLSPGPHAVEFDLIAASGPGVFDGSFVLFVDGVAVAKVANLDNSLARTDFVRLGALSVKGGAGGTIYWDEFESRRATFIGP